MLAANRLFSLAAKKTFLITRVIFLCVTVSAAVVAVVRPKGHTQWNAQMSTFNGQNGLSTSNGEPHTKVVEMGVDWALCGCQEVKSPQSTLASISKFKVYGPKEKSLRTKDSAEATGAAPTHSPHLATKLIRLSEDTDHWI